MKISRKDLRYIIREMAFDPSLYPDLSKKIKDIQSSDYLDYPERDYRRSMGLLTREESDEEKEVVKSYNENHRQELMKFFAELKKPMGRITALHSPGYVGASTKKYEYFGDPGNSPSAWINQFGSQGRNDISVILVPQNVKNLMNALGEANSDMVFDGTYSFIMSGYPKMINHRDMMTQTSTAIPKELIDFQVSSGTTKSYNKEPSINNFDEFLKNNTISQETVLSNWQIKGVFSVMTDFANMTEKEKNLGYNIRTKEVYENLVRECNQLNIPLHVMFRNYNEDTYDYSFRYERAA